MVSKEKRQQVVDFLAKGVKYEDIRDSVGVSLGFISGEAKRLPAGRFWERRANKQPSLTRNILVVGDLHAPFIREGYLEFCQEQYKAHNCNMVIFTGDCVDSHFSSYHEANPDGMAAGDELDAAVSQLKKWHEAFPNAKVCLGNHDRIAHRKAFSSGVSSRWVKDYADVLECPTWDFQLGFDIDGVRYEHGEGAKPHIKMLRNRQSYVCGHVHSKLSIEFSVSEHDRLFAMQLGWGGDQSAYSMDYARNFAKGIVSCGVVLNNGTMPIAIPMPLMQDEKNKTNNK